jgi:hypothetical protein
MNASIVAISSKEELDFKLKTLVCGFSSWCDIFPNYLTFKECA